MRAFFYAYRKENRAIFQESFFIYHAYAYNTYILPRRIIRSVYISLYEGI